MGDPATVNRWAAQEPLPSVAVGGARWIRGRLHLSYLATSRTMGLLGTKRDLLGLDDPKELAVHTEGVIGGTVVGGELLNGNRTALPEGVGRVILHHAPAGRLELRVDQALTRAPF